MGGGIGRIQPLTFIGQFRFSREREREGGGGYMKDCIENVNISV